MAKLAWSDTDENNPYFPYTHEMNVYIESKIKKGVSHYFVHKTWPEKWKIVEEDTGKVKPTYSSVRRRYQKVEQYGADKLRDTKDDAFVYFIWTTEMNDLIKKTYREQEGSIGKTKRLVATILGRSFSQVESQLQGMQDRGELEIQFEGKGQSNMSVGTTGWIARLEGKGWQIDKDFDKHIGKHTFVPVLCPAGLHRYKKQALTYKFGCRICNTFNKHPAPLAPGIFYYGPLLDSPLNDLKLGITLERIGVKERSKKYGKFEWKEIHKPIEEVENFEGKMKIKYEKYCTYNPMLKGNGSTECFDKAILPELEKDIKEWIK